MSEHRTGLKVLACVEEGARELALDSETLAGLYEE